VFRYVKQLIAPVGEALRQAALIVLGLSVVSTCLFVMAMLGVYLFKFIAGLMMMVGSGT